MTRETKKIPFHLGIIMDGNRRWARKKGLPNLEGHRKGSEIFTKIGEWVLKRGVKILTVYAFSIENWKRSKIEVNYLMRLFNQSLSRKNLKKLHQKGIKLQIIGQKERLSKKLQKKIKEAEQMTKNNKKGILNLAISYG